MELIDGELELAQFCVVVEGVASELGKGLVELNDFDFEGVVLVMELLGCVGHFLHLGVETGDVIISIFQILSQVFDFVFHLVLFSLFFKNFAVVFHFLFVVAHFKVKVNCLISQMLKFLFLLEKFEFEFLNFLLLFLQLVLGVFFDDGLESCFEKLELIFEVGVLLFEVVEFSVEFLQAAEELIVSELEIVGGGGEFAVDDFELNDTFGEFLVSVLEVLVLDLDSEELFLSFGESIIEESEFVTDFKTGVELVFEVGFGLFFMLYLIFEL